MFFAASEPKFIWQYRKFSKIALHCKTFKQRKGLLNKDIIYKTHLSTSVLMLEWWWWSWSPELLMRMLWSWLVMLGGKTLTWRKTNISIIDNKQNILRNIRRPIGGWWQKINGKTEWKIFMLFFWVFFWQFITLGIQAIFQPKGRGKALYWKANCAKVINPADQKFISSWFMKILK